MHAFREDNHAVDAFAGIGARGVGRNLSKIHLWLLPVTTRHFTRACQRAIPPLRPASTVGVRNHLSVTREAQDHIVLGHRAQRVGLTMYMPVSFCGKGHVNNPKPESKRKNFVSTQITKIKDPGRIQKPKAYCAHNCFLNQSLNPNPNPHPYHDESYQRQAFPTSLVWSLRWPRTLGPR